MTIGLTNGSNLLGMGDSQSGLTDWTLNYGKPIGTAVAQGSYGDNKTIGVTSDPAKSGIVASFSNITLGDIPSLQLGKFCIRY